MAIWAPCGCWMERTLRGEEPDMTLLLDAVLIAIGVHVSIRTVAALYRIIDLWYTIRTAYPRVLGAIAVWTGMIFVLAAVLPDPRRAAFFWGFAGFVPFYVRP